MFGRYLDIKHRFIKDCGKNTHYKITLANSTINHQTLQ